MTQQLNPKASGVIKDLPNPFLEAEPVSKAKLQTKKKSKSGGLASISQENINSGNVLSMLKQELASPFLSLIEEYAKRHTSKNKSTNTALILFKSQLPWAFNSALFFDYIVRIVYITIIVTVGVRALGIIDVISKVYCK
jgi:hypothetical protein